MTTSASAGVGTSALGDAFAAGADAARAAAGGGSPGLVLVFGHPGHDPQALVDGVRSVLGEVPLAGCSTGGGGAPSVGVTALSAPGLELRTYHVRRAGRDPSAAARALVSRLAGHAAEGGLLYVLADGETTDGTVLLAELLRALPSHVRVDGGMASGWGASPAWQLHDGRAGSDGVSAALLTGDLEGLALARVLLSRACGGLRSLGPPRQACPETEDYPLRANPL